MARSCPYCNASLAATAQTCDYCGKAVLQPPMPPPFGPMSGIPASQAVAPFRSPPPRQVINQQYPQQQNMQAQPVPKIKKDTPSLLKNNWAYVGWFLFYFIIFTVFTGGVALIIYIISVAIAFSPIAEELWRRVSGIRPLRLKSEKERLLPLFAEVYLSAITANPQLPKIINLYIKEDMSINAFAFGKGTLVLTRGSIEQLDDACLKGLIAHELGHFAHRDTEAVLLATVSNFFMSFVFSKLTDFVNRHDSGFFVTLIKILFYYPLKAINFIGDLILMRKSRQNEYRADMFAYKSNFGKELADVLIKIYSIAIENPKSVKEQLKATHPHITLRIEQLEKVIY